MDEKKRRICDICSTVGCVLLLMYIILTIVELFAGITTYILAIRLIFARIAAIRLIFARIAAIAFAINFGIDISSSNDLRLSGAMTASCLLCAVCAAIELI